MYQLISLLLLLLMVGTDRLIKLAVVGSSLIDGAEIVVIPHVLQLRYIENTGAAFSLLEGKTVFLSVVTALVLAVGIYLIMRRRFKSKIITIAAFLLVGGGAGNLIDRVLQGYVVDYFEFLFIDFAVFNFADCLITVAEALLIVYLIVDIVSQRKKEKTAEKTHE